MKFCIQLSPYYPDKSYGGKRVFLDMVEQAKLADTLNFESVSITEHHLLNILMMPAPLQFAVKLAGCTSRLKLITSIAVLPLHDMRTYAGEVVAAEILTEGRLMLGVGRGAFAYEMERVGIPMDETRAKFDESLDVLTALLSRENVAWDGDYYKFEPITVMPRPVTPEGPPLMMAVLNPEAIYHCTKRGFHIQTTPLAGNKDLLKAQVGSFNRGKEELGKKGEDLTLSLSRVGFLSSSDTDKQRKVEQANEYFARFDNVFSGPGVVEEGLIKALPRQQSIEELERSLLIGSAQEVVDKLGEYANLGIDRFMLSCNFGIDQSETLECIQQFADEVMPHFAQAREGAAA